ncbi:2816_t:CDS:2, partial [Dentiscutata heterogama]
KLETVEAETRKPRSSQDRNPVSKFVQYIESTKNHQPLGSLFNISRDNPRMPGSIYHLRYTEATVQHIEKNNQEELTSTSRIYRLVRRHNCFSYQNGRPLQGSLLALKIKLGNETGKEIHVDFSSSESVQRKELRTILMREDIPEESIVKSLMERNVEMEVNNDHVMKFDGLSRMDEMKTVNIPEMSLGIDNKNIFTKMKLKVKVTNAKRASNIEIYRANGNGWRM